MKISTDDLSFSGIVNQLQHDTKLGKKLLIAIYNESSKIDDQISKLEKEMNSLLIKKSLLKGGVSHISKHLELNEPIILVNKNEVLIFENETIRIEKNIIK